MKFSFSSVNSYNNCPRCFWLSYLQEPKLEKENNAFAQWGSFIHSLYERFYKGEIDFFDCCEEYQSHYKDNVTYKFPPNKWVDLGEKYHRVGEDVLERFDELPKDIEVVEIECRIDLTINNIKFCGYADLILRNKKTGDIIIVDHKSKSKFATAQEQKEYARQLYLYSLFVKEKYGKYPAELVFNMFRADEIVRIKFDEKELKESVDWFTSTVAKIYSDTQFLDKVKLKFAQKDLKLTSFKKDDFFCNYLCGVRKYCNRADAKIR